MKYLKYIITFFLYLNSVSLSAQCPDRDFLWNRITALRDSAGISDSAQLKGLLGYADQIKACNYTNDSSSSFLYQRIGAVYFYLGDFDSAVKYTQRSIDIIHNGIGKPYVNETRLIKCYSNLQLYYDSLKELKYRSEALDSSISIAIRLHQVDLITLRFIWERSTLLNLIGDYQRSIQYSEIGMSIAKEYRIDTAYAFAAIFSNYINALIFSEQYTKARKLLVVKIQEYIEHHHSIYLGGMYNLLALTYKQEGLYKEAVAYLLKSYDHQRQINYRAGCAESLNTLGFLYFEKLKDYKQALKYYKQALQYSNATEAVNIFDNIANVYAQNNQFDSAQYFFQKSFEQIKPGMNEQVLLGEINTYIDASYTEYITNLVLDKADTYLQQYLVEHNQYSILEALRIYGVADLLLDKMKSEQVQSRLFWRTHTRRLYEHAIESSFLTGNHAKGFYFFEKSRAALLQDQLLQLRTISDIDISKQARLKRRILQLEQEKISLSASSNSTTTLQNELFAKTQELTQLDQIIKQKNPMYYQSFVDTSLISIADVKKNLLKDHDALLELYEGDSNVYSILITPVNVYFNKIDKVAYDSTASSYNNYISNLSTINQNFGAYANTANHLYKLIFGENKFKNGRIIISPSGHYFPFESLITSVSPTPVYFLKDHAVSYTYSARYLMSDFTSNASGVTGTFLGFAPVQFASAFSLAALQGSDVSLKEIGSFFNDPKMLVAAQATKSEFLKDYLNYKVIQLYTHAADSSENGEPVIHFADSSLYLSDLIAERRPFTRLIVLSACETGNGKLYQGEGVFSFNRGFAAVGIPSSVTNLWSVDNKATYKLTEFFYRYISEGLPIDVALQKAKLKFMSASKESSLPYYWAATILAGKTDSLGRKKNNPLIDLAVITLIIAGLVAVKKRKSKGYLSEVGKV